jgi:hypothetical protein
MGLGSGIRKKPIPDPGSRGQKGTGSRIRIRDTVFFSVTALIICLCAHQLSLSLSLFFFRSTFVSAVEESIYIIFCLTSVCTVYWVLTRCNNSKNNTSSRNSLIPVFLFSYDPVTLKSNTIYHQSHIKDRIGTQ